MKTHAAHEEATATQRQPAAQDASTRNPHTLDHATDQSPRMLAQRRQIESIFGPAAQRRPIHIEAAPQATPLATPSFGHAGTAQRALRIKSQSGTYPYNYGGDFTRDHIGGQADALAVLRQRYNDDGSTAPVTVITQLDGQHDASEVTTLPGYQFSLSIDVAGWTANWNAQNKAVATQIDSAVLSGYLKQKGKRGLITHISSSG